MLFAIETFPNKSYVTVHTDAVLPEVRYEFRKVSSGLFNDNPLSHEAERLGSAISAVPGVIEASAGLCDRCAVRLKVGGVFSREDVARQVAEVVRREVDPDGKAVEVPFAG